jgi:hypothetical protein
MIHRRACIALIAAASALAACDGREANPPASEPTAAAPPPSPEAPAAPARYVGRWASQPANCDAGAWTFQERRLATAGEVACEFEQVTETARGYRVMARCVAQAPPEPHTFSLTFEGPADAPRMTVDGGPWSGPISLGRCDG